MKVFIITLFAFTFFAGLTIALTIDGNCNSENSRQFDFWIGNWSLDWKNADGTNGKGTNVVKKIYDGCVIEENFDGTPSIPLKGKSFSVYDEKNKIWKQTWVDNNGSYLDFKGGMIDNKMILKRNFNLNGNKIFQRMIFYNIGENEFDWNWEKSTDEEKTWQLLWKIHYMRK